jgi:hypothetical protein
MLWEFSVELRICETPHVFQPAANRGPMDRYRDAAA